MLRKIRVLLLTGVICLLGVTSALAYNEAPILQTKVAAGELPLVENRLPENPLVIEPVEQIGQYGGTLQVFSHQATKPGDGACINTPEPILLIGYDCSSIVPNVAESWELAEDTKSITLHLRKGMRWSDGAPYTADDILFWWEDIMLNEELTPALEPEWTPGGEPMEVEKLDAYTVRWKFSVPYPVIPAVLAGGMGTFWTQIAKHYLKEFHINYNPAADELAKENGFDHWYEYYGSKTTTKWSVPYGAGAVGVPTLTPYKLVEVEQDYMVYERNPYYWKVDTAGNQLPYIDKLLVRDTGGNREIYNAKIISGEANFAAYGTSFDNIALYLESAEASGYRVLKWSQGVGSAYIYVPNQTYEADPVLRGIFRDVNFRRALSLAINREEINDILFYGVGTPGQFTVVSQSVLYEPRFGQAYAQYDLQEANRLLDEMGLQWDANNEYRLRPDGERLSWIIEYCVGGDANAMSELVKEYWKEIGCDVSLQSIAGELMAIRAPANEIAMTVNEGDFTTDMAVFKGDMPTLIPIATGWDTFNALWAQWYTTGGELGEEPPEEVKNLYEWRDAVVSTVDREEKIELLKQILTSQAENLWAIGTVSGTLRPIIVKSNLRNVPAESLYTWDVIFTRSSYPEQYYLEQ